MTLYLFITVWFSGDTHLHRVPFSEGSLFSGVNPSGCVYQQSARLHLSPKRHAVVVLSV